MKDLNLFDNTGLSGWHTAAINGTLKDISQSLFTKEVLLLESKDGQNVISLAFLHGNLEQIPLLAILDLLPSFNNLSLSTQCLLRKFITYELLTSFINFGVSREFVLYLAIYNNKLSYIIEHFDCNLVFKDFIFQDEGLDTGFHIALLVKGAFLDIPLSIRFQITKEVFEIRNEDGMTLYDVAKENDTVDDLVQDANDCVKALVLSAGF